MGGMEPLREMVSREMERRGVTLLALARTMEERRGGGERGRGVEVTLRQVLGGTPRAPGGKPREMSERMLSEILDALGAQIQIVPTEQAPEQTGLDIG